MRMNGKRLSFQSTHPLRGATKLPENPAPAPQISIHAPLAGCDNVARRSIKPSDHFNPRTPCGVRHLHHDTQRRTRRFQSTHPLRGATDLRGCLVTSDGISIHAPLAGCDEREVFAPARGKHFNPRTPCGVRLPQCAFDVVRAGISIHAPLAGCDILRRGKDYINLDFNPRTPCGVRRASLLNGTLIF